MAEQASLPFHSFAFTLIEDGRPRTALRLTAVDVGERAGNGGASAGAGVGAGAGAGADESFGMYELHVEKGSAANPSSQFTRKVPVEVAQRLRDSLQEIGVFNWAEEYGEGADAGDGAGAGADAGNGGLHRRWTVTTVFKKDVFSVASKGRGVVPPGFDDMLEELYRLDFPRPKSSKGQAGQGGAPGLGSIIGASGFRGAGGLSAGDLGAFSSYGSKLGGGQGFPGAPFMSGLGDGSGADFSQIADALQKNGFPDFDASDMGDLLAEVGSNPQALQDRMREEFRHMSPDEQNRMLDALASTGMASRAWWERFLRG